LAPFVRKEFVAVPAAFALAAAGLWVTGPRGRALRAGWSRGDTLGAVLLVIGGAFLFNRVFLQHVTEWQIATQYWKHRMVDLGFLAGGAFAIGMGILPVIGGLASLWLPERRGDPAYRAFAFYLGASIVAVSLYAASKAAYLSTVFSTLIEERNMFYLSPLMLVGTALVFGARRVNWWLIGAATAFVGFIVLTKDYDLSFGYFEAPGLSILTFGNRHLAWDMGDLHWALAVTLAVSVGLIAARRLPGVPALAAVLVGAWMLTAEHEAAAGFDALADAYRANLPAHLDWVDRATGGQRVTYLGQNIINGAGVQLTEFWNRSLDRVYSLDGTAPGPGPTASPDILRPDGTLSSFTGDPYALADNGVNLKAPLVAQEGQLRLYHVGSGWQLRESLQGVYPDGWAGAVSAYNYYGKSGPGTLQVDLGRSGYNGTAPAGNALIEVGTVRIDKNHQPAFGRVITRRHALVRNFTAQTISIPVAHSPVRVLVRIHPTFVASRADGRHLGAQVGFRFIPKQKG
jgi:hypothetical protein